MTRPIATHPTADGGIAYDIAFAPADLPAVRPRDLLACWDEARSLAASGDWGVMRHFRFAAGPQPILVSLTDADAGSWAEAVDARAGLDTPAGLSLCLRLLALVQFLASHPQARCLVHVQDGEATLDRTLVANAAHLPLDDQAAFDPAALLAATPAAWQAASPRIGRRPAPPRPLPLPEPEP